MRSLKEINQICNRALVEPIKEEHYSNQNKKKLKGMKKKWSGSKFHEVEISKNLHGKDTKNVQGEVLKGEPFLVMKNMAWTKEGQGCMKEGKDWLEKPCRDTTGTKIPN